MDRTWVLTRVLRFLWIPDTFLRCSPKFRTQFARLVELKHHMQHAAMSSGETNIGLLTQTVVLSRGLR